MAKNSTKSTFHFVGKRISFNLNLEGFKDLEIWIFNDANIILKTVRDRYRKWFYALRWSFVPRAELLRHKKASEKFEVQGKSWA